MSQFRLLEEVVKILFERNIPYMLTGSIVSSLQGIPRSTHDIDIIISIDKTDIHKITEAFSKDDYYINEKSIEAAIIKILNEDGYHRNYIIDYNGNKDVEELKASIINYIEKHKTFYTDEFAKECLNELSCVYYFEDLEVIVVKVLKDITDLSEL